MSLIQTKQNCLARPFMKKYEASQEVAKELPKLTVARKCDEPNNSLSTRIKNKDKMMKSYRKCDNIKRRRRNYSSNERFE